MIGEGILHFLVLVTGCNSVGKLGTNEIYRVHVGQELALVCRGRGDPTPVIKWKRQVINFIHYSISVSKSK